MKDDAINAGPTKHGVSDGIIFLMRELTSLANLDCQGLTSRVHFFVITHITAGWAAGYREITLGDAARNLLLFVNSNLFTDDFAHDTLYDLHNYLTLINTDLDVDSTYTRSVEWYMAACYKKKDKSIPNKAT